MSKRSCDKSKHDQVFKDDEPPTKRKRGESASNNDKTTATKTIETNVSSSDHGILVEIQKDYFGNSLDKIGQFR